MKRMFTQKQIENIAKDVVNENIPSIAEALSNVFEEKLYRHKLSFYDGDDNALDCEYISSSPSQYTLADKLLFDDLVGVYDANDTVGYISSDSESIKINGTIDIVSIEDVVTPL